MQYRHLDKLKIKILINLKSCSYNIYNFSKFVFLIRHRLLCIIVIVPLQR